MTKRYLAIMPNAWGEGATIKQAIRNARHNHPMGNAARVWLVGPTARVDDRGDIRYAADEAAPELAYSTDYAV